MAMKAKADMIVDLQYGSTGKGLIAGYLAMKNEYDVVVTANMPNAGHTFIDILGQKMVHKVLPNGVVSPKCRVALIGPGAVFDIQQLEKELQTLHDFGYDHFDVVVHPNAVILKPEYKEAEKDNVKIGSTMQGSGAAIIEKIKRNPKSKVIAADFGPNDLPVGVYVGTHDQYNVTLRRADKILLEGAQGFSLGINERFYPFCTSRDCTPARFMADMGVPLPLLHKTIGTARMHPIRVGSPPGGHSGGCYLDQTEISWELLGVPVEKTTVTQRDRRVFTFSRKQMEDALFAMAPDEIFLNFCNYSENLAYELEAAINKMMVEVGNGGHVRYMGWGPTVADVRENIIC